MFLLREWRISLAVLFISLMGICGCLLALWITGVPLNVSSYTGIIMIVGILAENSIFTVWQYRMNRRCGGTVEESVDYAIALRIRPKLMTAIGAILALMPLALGTDTEDLSVICELYMLPFAGFQLFIILVSVFSKSDYVGYDSKA